jgi:Cysteine-rich secretory protein family/Lytic transglycolase
MRYLLKTLPIFLVSWSISAYAYDATYYADSFEWSRTANGDIFHQDDYSAAICGEKLGQYAYVYAGWTWSVITINDRPNCARFPTVIDLSKIAFQKFARLEKGRIPEIWFQVLGPKSSEEPKKEFSKNQFAHLWIELTKPLANTQFTKDTITIEAHIIDQKTYAILYIGTPSWDREITRLARADSRGSVRFVIPTPDISGDYYFVISSGNSFSVEDPATLVLIDQSSLIYPEIPRSSLSYRPQIAWGIDPYLSLPTGTWWSLDLVQWSRRYRISGSVLSLAQTGLTPDSAKVSIEGYTLSSPSPLDRSRSLGTIYSGSVILDYIRDEIGRDRFTLKKAKNAVSIKFKTPHSDRIRQEYYLTTPDGRVIESRFAPAYIDADGFLKRDTQISLSLPIRDPGIYKFEVVLENGYAYINTPLYQGTVWPIIQRFTQTDMDIRDTPVIKPEMIQSVNALRIKQKKEIIRENKNLTALAQAKAEDMAKYEYVGHWTNAWEDIRQFALKSNISIPSAVWENVAGWNISDIVLQYGLEESGSHRSNMLNPLWKSIGIGVVVREEKVYIVQIFGNE